MHFSRRSEVLSDAFQRFSVKFNAFRRVKTSLEGLQLTGSSRYTCTPPQVTFSSQKLLNVPKPHSLNRRVRRLMFMHQSSIPIPFFSTIIAHFWRGNTYLCRLMVSTTHIKGCLPVNVSRAYLIPLCLNYSLLAVMRITRNW